MYSKVTNYSFMLHEHKKKKEKRTELHQQSHKSSRIYLKWKKSEQNTVCAPH